MNTIPSAAVAGRYLLSLRGTTRFSDLYTGSGSVHKYHRRTMSTVVDRFESSRQPVDRCRNVSRDVAVYIHWPYCKKMCSYCNFNRYVKEDVDHERMRKCLVTELKTSLAVTKPTSITSVFFGGGTPTLAQPQTIKALLDVMVDEGLIERDKTEVTMEGNPSSTEIAQMELFRNAGVNRMSLGVQSLISPEDLLFLGRNHSIDEALAAVEVARQLFPGRFSIDLIFGRPGQTRAQWQAELDAAMELVDSHVSLYQLTIEPGTKLHRLREKGALHMPCEDTMADMYDDAVNTLAAEGLERYEVSNFARPGAECAHNQNYWQGGDYIGLGPGAHSRMTLASTGAREERVQAPAPEQWMTQVEAEGHGTRKRVVQTQQTQLHELIMMGLRTREGIQNSLRWQTLTDGRSPFEYFHGQSSVHRMQQAGLVVCDPVLQSMRATPAGVSVADSILSELL